jgi:hypothetical protein
MVCPYPDTRGSTHPCGNNIDVKPIMQKNKREIHEGTCVGQSVGVCGGRVKLVKRKRKTLEGTCVGQCIGSGQFGSIELDGSIGLDGRGKADGGRALDLVGN